MTNITLTNDTMTYIHSLLKENHAVKAAALETAGGVLWRYFESVLPFELEVPCDAEYVVECQLKAGPDRDKGRELKAIYDAALKAELQADLALHDFEKHCPDFD